MEPTWSSCEVGSKKCKKSEKRFVIRREMEWRKKVKLVKLEVLKVSMVKLVQRKNGVKSEMRNVIRREVGWNF